MTNSEIIGYKVWMVLVNREGVFLVASPYRLPAGTSASAAEAEG